MKTIVLLLSIFLIPFSSFSYVEKIDAQEPSPPPIPQPEPEPEPIPRKEPKPIEEPFPGLTDAEKLEKLMQENEELKSEIDTLTIQKNFLQSKVDEVTKKLEDLQAVALEQIKVIMSLVAQLKNTIFEKTLSPIISLI